MSQKGFLTTTISTCAACARLIPARVHVREGGVWFLKSCPQHGPQEVRVSADVQAYLDASRFHRAGAMPLRFDAAANRGCPQSCGLCPEHEQHVCLPILEITDHCDLACPICLVRNRAQRHLTRAEVAAILDRLIAAEGQIDVLNLAGGEPTRNPDFRGIVDECVSRPEIVRVSVSTNGLALLHDPALLEHLAARNVVVAFQFDGFHEATYAGLRGRPLLDEKLRLIEAAGRLDLPMSLTVTAARGLNDLHLAPILDLLFTRDHILSVMVQPLVHAGRAAVLPRPPDALTLPDVIRLLDGARGGRVQAEDFSPLPCSHPACFSLAYYLRTEGDEFLPVKSLVEANRYLDLLQNRAIPGSDGEAFRAVQDTIYELWSGPQALAPDSQRALAAARRLVQAATCDGRFQPRMAMARAERSLKSIFIHAFMDAHTFDLARARKCCNVYPQPDGRLLPACVRNVLRS
jgi:7,8-dihydro-6-hydroxymethylpterin dimethyltransferase